MRGQGLRDKDKAVLTAIVENYLKIGRPISSGFVAQKKILADSPATIRNIMARLEDGGFLSQPHASSGRVPTDKGLRFYVNSLLSGSPLTFDQVHFLAEDLAVRKGDLQGLLRRASRLLAEHSDSLGFVISPRISKIHFHHLRFIRISEGKVMIILVTAGNLVLTEIVATEAGFGQAELDGASQYLNRNFRDKTLLSVRDVLLRDIGKSKLKFEQALGRLMRFLGDSIVQDEGEDPLIVQGASQLIGKFETFDLEKLRSLFQNIESKAALAKLLADVIALDRVKVLIGAETNVPAIVDCSLVLSHYGERDQVLGSLGIIGPKRIPYGKIIPLVDNVAKKLTQTISQA
ncbi:MAG: heat-inducible transcription repressor HrcA [Candidatus Aminicenantes bacterium]|nr:heat-inducible transcription repressor HrcA [Candidatus Aminicenantes bacterium]